MSPLAGCGCHSRHKRPFRGLGFRGSLACRKCAGSQGLKLRNLLSTSKGAYAYTWTPAVCETIAFWAVLGGSGLFCLHTFVVQV